MALILADRVQETATANTTVSFSLAGASTGYQTFSAAIGNTNTTYYGASDGTNWEVGIGTYATTGNLLNRTTILSSSNAGSAVAFSGTVTVFVDYPAGKSIYLDASGNASALGTPAAFVATNVTGLPISTGVSGLGTGVATALGVNTGTAGSFVVNGGVLGTPSSGTVTNLTGTASININGTVGATTPAAGTFTNISSATAPTNTVPAVALTGTPNNAAGGKVGVLAVGSNFTASDKNIMASFVQNINDYTQIVVQNPNAGTAASADFVVNNDNTTGSGVYGDFGINSSAFTGTGSFNAANNIYLYSNGGDLVIGTQTANIVRYVIGSGTAADAGTITSTGLNAFPIGATTASTGAFTTLSASSTVSGTGFSTYLASPPAIGGTAAAAGTFTTLSCTSTADTGALARSTGQTANVTINNTTTYTTGGITLASQSAAANAVWRVRAFGQYTAANSATARTARVACFWGATQLTAITSTVLTGTAQTTQWQCEFTLTASSATAIWTAGTFLSRVGSTTALAIDNATPASTGSLTTTSTLDLRFSMSNATPADSWIVQSVIMERLE